MLSCIVSGAVSASQFPRNHNASSMNRTVTDPQPLLFFAWLGLGLSSFLSSIVTLLLQPDILIGRAAMTPTVMAWTHLMILGWLCSIFFAAGYQLTPVVTLKPLASRWLSRIHFAFHLIGMPIMVYAFFTGHYEWLAVGGSLVVTGFVLFVINALLSAGMQSHWNHLSLMWASGIFWLLVGATVALIAVFMRLNLIDGGNFNTVLAVHIHTMIVGFFLMILMAAASKLVPMFMLSPEQPQYGSWVAGMLLNLVMFATYFGFNSLDSHFRSLLSVTLLAAILAYFSQLTYFALKKRRKWDAGMTLFYLANFMLLPAWWQFFRFHSLPDAGATSASIDTLRAGVFIVTFLAFNGCILGMSQKIVPFMLWHHLYAKHLGKAKVPQTVDLLHAWTLWPIASSYLLSALLYLIALKGQNAALIRPATVFMLLAFFFVACNAPQFIKHWKNPVLIPFKKKS